MSFRKACLAAIVWFFVLPATSQAIPMGIDEILYEGAGTDASVLSGSADMRLSGNTLEIILRNTSSGVASREASHNLLTGIGFNLPNGVYIDFGSATVPPGMNTINFSGSDVSGEWGYDNPGLDAGPFQTAPAGVAQSSVNTTITTMSSSTTDKFSDTPVNRPAGLAGPDFGLLSSEVDARVAGGQAAIQDTLAISVTLRGLDKLATDFDLLSWMEARDIVLSFGSPDHQIPVVPESATLFLFAMGLFGLFSLRKRRYP